MEDKPRHRNPPFAKPTGQNGANGRHSHSWVMSGYELFLDICRRVESGELKADEGMSEIKDRKIQFLDFDIDQIQAVQNAAWLSDEVAVDIMKSWMRRQDEILLLLRAHLVVRPTISKDRLLEFTRAVRNPAQEPDLIVEDIIYQLATAGGTRDAVNPMEEGLITAVPSSELPDHRLCDMFSFQPGKYWLSQATQSQYVTITLPPFLKAHVVSYKLRGPPRAEGRKAQGGISSWTLYASNDEKNFQTTLDIRTENKDLLEADSVAVFPVTSEQPGYYRCFRLVNTGVNHQNNLSIFLAGFDLTGKLIICRE